MIPTVRQFVLCNYAFVEQKTNLPGCIGIFRNILVKSFPVQQNVFFYLGLADLGGTLKVFVRIEEIFSGEVIFSMPLNFENLLGDFTLVWNIVPVFKTEGNYILKIIGYGEILAQTDFFVKKET